MMLAALLNTPRSDAEWQRWAFDHRDSHDRIRDAVRRRNHVDLTDRVIDPISADRFEEFLQNNASLHTDMNDALNLQSVDLETVDASKENELQAWIHLHYQEHQNAEQLLGI
jgi:hypothetical protein